VLSETVLVLDGCLNCGDADRGSWIGAVRRNLRTHGPMDRIAMLDHFEYEYEYEYEYEHEHEHEHEHDGILCEAAIF